jgi:prolyl-tRNA synthetase
MRITEFFLPTLREEPQDAEISSHKLMLKAGLIRKVASGIYSYLPLGLISLQKLENIIREEMNATGAIEVLFPAILPKEIWTETDRWSDYGKEMFRLKDRKEREFCLGPTHEEAVVDLFRNEIHSYKELPKTLYQIQTKYRDEIRPRFGLVRAREFIMKDAYSFDATEEDLEKTYLKIFNAYKRIFKRCGLTTISIEADSGAIGGKVSHEFVVKSAFGGESEFIHCPECGYAANIEAAKSREPQPGNITEDEKTRTKVNTSEAKTIEEVANFLKIDKTKLAKSLLYKIDNESVLAIVRGDDELNETKLKNLFNGKAIHPAESKEVFEIMGANIGAIGPVGKSNIKVVMDKMLAVSKNFVTGANEDGYHLINVNIGRDFNPSLIEDIRTVKEGDLCPICGTKLKMYNGIEVGHTFKLGAKYSEKMHAVFLDKEGIEKYYIMGCYGIGIGRTLQAVIEEHHDDLGIKWPVSIAPFHVEILSLNMSDEEIRKYSDKLYNQFLNEEVEVLIDDRTDVSAGVKFNDADLIGVPLQIIIGKKFKENGMLEVKIRETGKKTLIEKEKITTFVKNFIESNPEINSGQVFRKG